MIAFLDKLISELFGQRETLPIRVRADEDEDQSPRDKQLKGRK